VARLLRCTPTSASASTWPAPGTSSPSRAQGQHHRGHALPESKPIILESIEFYNPVISQAIEAKTPADQEKLPEVLGKISEEDPTLKVKYDEERPRRSFRDGGASSRDRRGQAPEGVQC